ncbi:aldehyde oxidase GLOX-like [Elaeis guineensis]|uniref:Aldehyde oxidase GLOX n=1 Tax=Elaeis guineensis var. tenera TaxID=51953 RepID=A0A6I9QXM9_ELAGV|nr:aldehyde oxidase GLOX-like [Elaeis guineensis]
MKPIPVHFPLSLFLLLAAANSAAAGGGGWDLLQRSIGVSAMHMQLLHNDRVIIFDRTDFGRSNLSLPDGKCRNDPNEKVLKIDCTAHSAEYDLATNTFRPLMILTDSWCSSGTVAPDGRLIQTGGWNDGDRAVRTFVPCNDGSCDWSEDPQGLAARRWYATNQILPDGRAIIVGGRKQFNFEFHPKPNPSDLTTFPLPFLQATKDDVEDNLYPFVHLNIDGNLFIFANNRAILLDYTKNAVVRTYPEMPGGDPRNYPSSGSSVLLPLKPSATEAEVLVCGGAPMGSYTSAREDNYMQALKTCGRIKITDQSPSWSMETMPTPRVMGDMILLPSGEVLLLNGAAAGTAGWELGHEPVLTPVLYRPESMAGSRFQVQNPATIPRLYHSSAILIRDGRVLVGGSNPHVYYNFTGVDFPTELSLEAFSPEYLSSENSNSRPKIDISASPISLNYGKQFSMRFAVGAISGGGVTVTMAAPAFSTHSFSMNQRLLILETGTALSGDNSSYEVTAVAPASGVLAPSGYYLVFVVNGGIPSEGVWAHIK